MKKIIGVIVFLVCILCVYITSRVYYDPSILKKCFDKSGAELIRMDIEGTGRIKTDDSCRTIAKELLNASGIVGEYKIEDSIDSSALKLDDNGIHLVIRTKKDQSKNFIYASVILSQYNGDMNITNIRRSISKTFSIYNVKPSFSSLIQGKYDGALTITQMKERADRVLTENNANFVEGVDDGNMVSVSGYISGIEDRIGYMGKWVNLNAALRYSRTDGCTYIWVGSPIILLEY